MSIDKSKDSLCVICHQPMDLSKFGQKDITYVKNYVGCPNGHLVHKDCLKEWVINSKSCPVCMEDYELHIIQIFQDYLDQIELDKKRIEIERKQQEEARINAEKQKYEFDSESLDKFNRSLILFDKGQYDKSIKLLWDISDRQNYETKDERNLKLLLHLGRAYYKSGKHTLAIRQLMKLVKIKFDYPLGFYFLGLSYESVDLPDKAKWAYERSLKNLEKAAENSCNFDCFIDNVKSRIEYLSKTL